MNILSMGEYYVHSLYRFDNNLSIKSIDSILSIPIAPRLHQNYTNTQTKSTGLAARFIFLQGHLFTPMDAELGGWSTDVDHYNFGSNELYVTARDMAKFGLLYLNDGEYNGEKVVSTDWVNDSLKRHSEGMDFSGWLPGITSQYGPFRNLGYGYQWWSARVGDHQINYALGHGGSLIVLLEELDMVVVTTADPLKEQGLAGPGGWAYESSIIELVGNFIYSLPKD